MSEEKRLARKDHRSRSPTPASFLPDFLPDALEKTKDTMDDARECAPLVHTPLMRNGALASTTRESTSRALATAHATQATTCASVYRCVYVRPCASVPRRAATTRSSNTSGCAAALAATDGIEAATEATGSLDKMTGWHEGFPPC